MELVSMWVEPDARRSGVARHLVAAVTEDARRRGSRSVILWVAHTNAAAERLYAGCGFVRTGRVQPIDDSDPTRGSEFQMQLPLSIASRDDSQS